jgi:hypothetical protein
MIPPARCAKRRSSSGIDFHDQGRLVEDEGMRCFACGFNSRKPGTPIFAWVRTREETEPGTIELCEICNGRCRRPADAAGARLRTQS